MVSLYSTGKTEDVKEQNEVSGSKGEANFVWRCKSCKVNDHPNAACLFFADWSPERGNGDN